MVVHSHIYWDPTRTRSSGKKIETYNPLVLLKCTVNRRRTGLCRKQEATNTEKGNGAKGREADWELRRGEGFEEDGVMGMSAL